MARVTSPAHGCLLKLVQVQVGQATETYDAKEFKDGLELSLEGQRSLGSECGILSLIIATGSKTMLSIRLSDILFHSATNDGIVTIDQTASKLCVKLPTSDHILRVWFRNNRDFLVSVCILRRSGFTINDGVPITGTTNTTMKAKNVSKRMQCDVKVVPQASSIMQTAARTKQAKVMHNELPPIQPLDNFTDNPGVELFDEIIAMLHKQGECSQASTPTCTEKTRCLVERTDLPYLNPYKVFSSKSNTLNRPEISSPLRNIVKQDQKDIQAAVPHKIPNLKRKPETLVRRHGYFTRSFSASNYHQACDDTTLDLSSSLNFRDLMPKRRKLPFLVSQRMASQPLQTDQRTAGPKGLFLERNTACHPLKSDLTVILPENFAFEKLDGVLAVILDQYERDLARGCDAAHCAEFYVHRMQRERTKFWLEEMQKPNFMEIRD